MSHVDEMSSPQASASASSAYPTAVDDAFGQIVRGAHETVDRVAAKAAPVVEQVRSSLSRASDEAHDRADQLGQLRDEWSESLRTTVREHPLTALAVALAVGVIVSRATAR